MLPLKFSDGVLEAACANPSVAETKKTLEELMGCPVSLRLASETDLHFAISRAYLAKDGQASPLLGELLVEAGMISPAGLDRALRLQKISGRRLGEILQDLRLISPEMLAAVLQKQEAAREGQRP